MATNPKNVKQAQEGVTEAKTAEPAEAKPKQPVHGKSNEPQYTVAEFAANAKKLFGTMPECVTAAFMQNGITKCTKSEAEEIVKDFIEKEVK